MIRYRLGTIGYAYPDWRGPFYPEGLGQGKWLGFYGGQFDSLELNTTFHAVPIPERVRKWASKVGPDFRFAVKTSRAITHDHPLEAAQAPMLQFIEIVRSFGQTLGPVLIQLPPHVGIDSFGVLDRLLDSLPIDVRYAVEFRHPSWVQDRTTDMLRQHNAAWVGLDHLDHPQLRRLRATADFLYVRLVGKHQRFKETNHEQVDVMDDLRKWHAAICREVRQSPRTIDEVWVMSSNDYAGHSPATLRRFAGIAGIKLLAAPVQSELF
ncbi:MAG TPA: DUF72 domain-containing protein [Tepidisphaeraceae bacterium]|nr:DUF72 domain-containing protein [Tepidisphaeraceae bacterium]